MRPSRRTAFSMVEMLAVIAIVAFLIGTLWMVLAPRVRASAQVSEVRSRLKQHALAINLYMIDQEGIPPISLEGLVPGLSTQDPRSGGHFEYTLSAVPTEYHGLRIADYGFEPAKDPVVKCGSINDWHGETITMEASDGRGGHWPYEVPALGPNDRMNVLGARLDGSVGWVPLHDEWKKNLPPLKPTPAR